MVNTLYVLHVLTLVLFVSCVYFFIRKQYLVGCGLGLILVVELLFLTEQVKPMNSPEQYCRKGYISVKSCPTKIVLTYLPMEDGDTWDCYTKWGWRLGRNCPTEDCANIQNMCRE